MSHVINHPKETNIFNNDFVDSDTGTVQFFVNCSVSVWFAGPAYVAF